MNHPLAAAAAPTTVLSFRLDAQAYAIDIRQVHEVRSYEPPTPLPRSPAWLLGATRLRETVIPVVDLRVRLALPAVYETETATAVLDLDGRSVGVVVDAVSDVLDLPASAWLRLPDGATPDRAGVLGLADGAGRAGSWPLILLDPEALLNARPAAPAGLSLVPSTAAGEQPPCR